MLDSTASAATGIPYISDLDVHVCSYMLMAKWL